MIEKIEICKAKIEDIPDVLKLYAQPDIDNGDILPLNSAIEVFNKFSKYPNYSLFVAKIDSAIVGTFELLIMDNLAHKGKPSAIVEDVIVDSSCRSRGIGKKMIEFAMALCRENGCYKLALSSNVSRKRAHRFYENIGFKKHGYSYSIDL